MSLDPNAQADLQGAIAAAIDVPMVTRYVVVAEAITSDGEQQLADLTSPGLPFWDFIGMLTSALQGREAQPLWSYDDIEEEM